MIPPSPVRRDDQGLIDELVGPLFLGLVVNFFLWGVQCTQSYYYYKSFRKTDKTWLKAAVALLFVTDFIESLCVTQACWIFLVHGWGDLNKVVFHPGWGFYATPLTDAFTASIVHCFYAQKIWTLLDAPYRHIFTIVVLALSLTQLTGGIGGSIFIYSIKMPLPEFFRFKTWASIWLVTAAVTDIVITSTMSWKLFKSRTGHKQTDDIITKLIRLTVETGLATAIVQIADIIIYLVWPLKSYHIVLAFVGPKVYSNSMLALLNSRRPPRAGHGPSTTLSWDTDSKQFNNTATHATQSISVARDEHHELNNKMRSRSRSANERCTAPDAGSYTTFPFVAKDPECISTASGDRLESDGIS